MRLKTVQVYSFLAAAYLLLAQVSAFAQQSENRQILTPNNLGLSYNCNSSKKIWFLKTENGKDVKVFTESFSWTPNSGSNLNLVLGNFDAILWIQKPYGSQNRMVSILQKKPSAGNNGRLEVRNVIALGTHPEAFSANILIELDDQNNQPIQVKCEISFFKND